MKKNSFVVNLIALCGMAGASVGIILNSMGVFYTPVAEALGVKVGTVSAYSTITMFVGAVFIVIYPRLLNDKNYRVFIYGGMILCVSSVFMMSFATKVFHFYILAATLALGNQCYGLYMITSLINSSVKKNLGTITGLVFSFSGVAGAIASPVVTKVINSYGWQMGYRAMALLLVIFLLPSLFAHFVYDSGKRDSGEEKGSFRYLQKAFVLIVILYCLTVMLTSMPQHFVGYSVTKNFDRATGALMLSATMIGNITFKFVSGVVRDRTNTAKTCFMVMAVSLVGTILLIVGGSKAVLLAGAFLFGGSYSIGSVLAPIMMREKFGLQNYKYTYPVACFFGASATALSLAAIGYSYDFTGSYIPALTVMGLFCVADLAIIPMIEKSKSAE